MPYKSLKVFLGLWFITFNFLTNNLKASSYEPKIGSHVFLKGCTADPHKYFDEPLNVANTIYEVPNTIVGIYKSPYGRPFETVSTSSIFLNDSTGLLKYLCNFLDFFRYVEHIFATWKKKPKNNLAITNYLSKECSGVLTITAQLKNFRDLKIMNEKGDVVLEKQIHGATSLYEIKYKGKTVAWAVGWHKTCGEYYKYVDFTAFRVFFPILKNGKIHISEQFFNGISQTQFKDVYQNSNQPILVGTNDWGSGAVGCYYCIPQFIALDESKGFVELATESSLKSSNLRIGAINSVQRLFWFSYYNDWDNLKNLLLNNFSEIIDDYQNFFWQPKKPDVVKLEKGNCESFLKTTETGKASDIIKKCFPSWS